MKLFCDTDRFLLQAENAVKLTTDHPALLAQLSTHPDWEHELVVACGVSDNFSVTLLSHYEVPHDFGGTRKYQKKAVDAAMDFFFGAWRLDWPRACGEEKDEAAVRKEYQWCDPYRESLACAFLLGDVNAAKQLSEYPRLDALQPRFVAKSSDQCFYIAFAMRLSDSVERDEVSYRQAIKKAQSKPYSRLMLSCLDAIEVNDAKRSATTLASLIERYQATGENRDLFQNGICLDATILWNFALCRGMTLPLGDHLRDLVVTPSTCFSG